MYMTLLREIFTMTGAQSTGNGAMKYYFSLMVT